MSANKIIERIRQDAQAEADAILADARAKAQANAQAIAQQGKAKAAEIKAAGEADCAEAHRRARLIAELDTRKNELAAKRAVIDEAFDGAAGRLASLPEGQWRGLIASIVLQGAETGCEKLRIPEKDRVKYTEEFLQELNGALKAKGLKGELTLDETPAAFEDGVMLVSDVSDINGSFEAVLRSAREELEKEVVGLLFSTEVG